MSSPIHKGEVLDVVPEAWGERGEAIAWHQGWQVRVRQGIPGEPARVRVGYVSTGGRVASGAVVSLPTPAEGRRAPPCPLHDRCSGCGLQHVREDVAFAQKSAAVRAAFAAEGLDAGEVEAGVGAAAGFGYRTKEVLLPEGIGRRLVLGARPHRGEHLVETRGCRVLHPAVERASARARGLLAQAFARRALPLAAADTDEGLRSVVIRGNRRGDVVVTLVHRGPDPGGALAEAGRALVGGPVVAAYLQRHDEAGNAVTGTAEPVEVAGRGPLREKMLGMLLEVPPAAFFQVNPQVAERLYSQVVKRARVPRGGRVLELFCGAAAAGLAVCREAGADLVGIESSASAVGSARRNAEANGFPGARFLAARVEGALPGVLAGGAFDAALLNPPRAGCPEAALRVLAAARIPRILYMSCNPETLARDAAVLAEGGYRLESALPGDLLPQTPHVEVLAVFVPGVAARVARPRREAAAPPSPPRPPAEMVVVQRRPAPPRPSVPRPASPASAEPPPAPLMPAWRRPLGPAAGRDPGVVPNREGDAPAAPRPGARRKVR